MGQSMSLAGDDTSAGARQDYQLQQRIDAEGFTTADTANASQQQIRQQQFRQMQQQQQPPVLQQQQQQRPPVRQQQQNQNQRQQQQGSQAAIQAGGVAGVEVGNAVGPSVQGTLTFAPGQPVEYFSVSQGGWISARVVAAKPTGLYDLDCKPDVSPQKIRLQQQLPQQQPPQKRQPQPPAAPQNSPTAGHNGYNANGTVRAAEEHLQRIVQQRQQHATAAAVPAASYENHGPTSRRQSIGSRPTPPPAAPLPVGPVDAAPRRQRRNTIVTIAPTSPGLQYPFFDGLDHGMTQNGQSFADDDDIGIASSAAAAAEPEPHPPTVGQGSVEVSTRVEYSALPRGQAQDVFGLVSVQAMAQPARQQNAERQPMDIVCVLDVSSSMDGDKIRNVQSAVRFVVSQADPKDRISIVSFESRATRQLRLCRMDAQGKDSAMRTALLLQAGGGTHIAAGLSMGISVMEQRRQKNNVSAILLLTDGQDYSTRPSVPALVERARATGSSIYAFGFGADHDAALLSSISEQAQTPFSFVEDDVAISAAFAGAVGGLSSVVAQDVRLELHHHVPLKKIHTPFTVRRVSDVLTIVTIQDLFAGEKKDILVELSAAPAEGTSETRLLDAFAIYKDLGKNGVSMQTPVAAMQAERVAEPQPEAEPDAEVQAHRERVQTAEVLQSAAAAADAGDFALAQDQLLHMSSTLHSKKKSRMSIVLAGELQDASMRMTSRVHWEQGGRAEVSDAVQMHLVQRCTNSVQSSKTGIKKQSKSLYQSVTQADWQEKSRSQSMK